MQKNKQIKKIAAVGDIHVKEDDRGKWVEYFRRISDEADILLLCGDVTDTGHIIEAEILAKELKNCTIPVIGILGNHDYERGMHKEVKKILENDNVFFLDGQAKVLNGIGFAGVKGFGGGFDKYALSMFGENAMKAFVQEVVDDALKLDRALSYLDVEYPGIPKIVMTHYAPIKETIQGEPPEIWPFLGSSRLLHPIETRDVIAAFHGHAHIGVLQATSPKGVKIFNVAKPVLEKMGYFGPYIFEIHGNDEEMKIIPVKSGPHFVKERPN
ncbi:MAG: metallophosphoesterase family protein [Bacteroidia bacterium]